MSKILLAVCVGIMASGCTKKSKEAKLMYINILYEREVIATFHQSQFCESALKSLNESKGRPAFYCSYGD